MPPASLELCVSASLPHTVNLQVFIQHPETGEWGEPGVSGSRNLGQLVLSVCAVAAYICRSCRAWQVTWPCNRTVHITLLHALAAGTVNGLNGFDDKAATVACRQAGMGTIGKRLPCQVNETSSMHRTVMMLQHRPHMPAPV